MAFWQNTPSNQSKLNATNLNNLAGGWTKVVETLTFASADSPTFVANTSADLTSYISVGMKLKLTQTTVKYFIVTAITSTTITLYGGTDYTLVNATITDVYFSVHKAPYGFPLNPDKWTIYLSSNDAAQISPTANTWYNVGSKYIDLPIGIWNLSYQTTAAAYVSAAADIYIYTTLSTVSNGETDQDYTSLVRANALQYFSAVVSRNKNISVSSKTRFYLNVMTTTINILAFEVGKTRKVILKAVCAYL